MKKIITFIATLGLAQSVFAFDCENSATSYLTQKGYDVVSANQLGHNDETDHEVEVFAKALNAAGKAMGISVYTDAMSCSVENMIVWGTTSVGNDDNHHGHIGVKDDYDYPGDSDELAGE